jgi:hypothetical protein
MRLLARLWRWTARHSYDGPPSVPDHLTKNPYEEER